MIVHTPMMIHPNPKRVLIVGGGDGGSAREVLKHPNLEKAVMIDIDEAVVNACKEFMPSVNAGAFDDPRLNLIIGDGIDYVKNAPDASFDVIIIDSTDPWPDCASECLYTEEFYKHCSRALADNGVMSTQSCMPMWFEDSTYNNSIKNLQAVFTKERAWIYLIPTDSYSGQTSFSLSFKGDSHPLKFDKERAQGFMKEKGLKYYNPKMHESAFCLPNYLRKRLGL